MGKCNRAIWTNFHIFIAPIWNFLKYSSIQITKFYTIHPNSHESSENSLLSNFQLIYLSITWQEGMKEGMSLSTKFSYCVWDVLGRVLVNFQYVWNGQNSRFTLPDKFFELQIPHYSAVGTNPAQKIDFNNITLNHIKVKL